MFIAMPSYSFSKSKGHMPGKNLGFTERGRSTDLLEKCFTALYSKDRTEEDLQNLEIFMLIPGKLLNKLFKQLTMNLL